MSTEACFSISSTAALALACFCTVSACDFDSLLCSPCAIEAFDLLKLSCASVKARASFFSRSSSVWCASLSPSTIEASVIFASTPESSESASCFFASYSEMPATLSIICRLSLAFISTIFCTCPCAIILWLPASRPYWRSSSITSVLVERLPFIL
ncbi:Uncharacterised protein [uncultured archaeon]|nr:Uncharacterised protein [uncultured archaeon]